MRFPLPAVVILALPLIEIAGFVIVGSEIGVLATVGLVVLSGIVGAVLLRIQGFGMLTRLRADAESGRDPSRQLVHGVMILVAGMLLVIPGFFSDIVGLLLFIPPVRDLAWRWLKDRITVATAFTGPGGHGPRRDRTIDLDEDDYSHSGDETSPWRRIDKP